MSKRGSSIYKEEEGQMIEDEMQTALADEAEEEAEHEADLMLTKEGQVIPMSEPEPKPILEIKSTEDAEDEGEEEDEEEDAPVWLTPTEPPKIELPEEEIDPEEDISQATDISPESEEELFGVPDELTSVPVADRLEPDDLSDLFEVSDEDVMGYSGVDDDGPDGSEDDLSDVLELSQMDEKELFDTDDTGLSKEDEKKLFGTNNLNDEVPKRKERTRRIIVPQRRPIYPTLGGLK